MNIKHLEQSIIRPQLIEAITFQRLPSFLQWTACVCIGYTVLVCLHMIFG